MGAGGVNSEVCSGVVGRGRDGPERTIVTRATRLRSFIMDVSCSKRAFALEK